MGDRVRVTVRRRSSDSAPADRGEVVIEDLSGVVTRLSARAGPNGPQGAVTQWMLREASAHLAEQLATDLAPRESGEAMPRILSALVGHEPFVKGVLDASIHQLNRRWPIASDWYADLIAYIMRPRPAAVNMTEMGAYVGEDDDVSLADLVSGLARFQLAVIRDPQVFTLAETLRTLWPDHPEVQAAYARVQDAQFEQATELVEFALSAYGLHLRPGVTAFDVVWAIQALSSWDYREERIRPDRSDPADPVDGAGRPRSARAVLQYLAGALQDRDGAALTLADLYARRPLPDEPTSPSPR